MVDALIKSEKGLNKTEIAKRMHVSTAVLSNHLNPDRPIPEEFIEAFFTEFSLNRGYYETGTGSPLTDFVYSESNNLVAEQQQDYKRDIVTPGGKIIDLHHNRRKSDALIPFYNADFMAGASEMFYEDAAIYPEYFMDVPEFYGCTAFRAYSDSMEKKIKSGNILFGIKLDDWRVHLELGGIYGITMTDGRRYLKYIRTNPDDKKLFLLKSENKNYDDFTIPKSKIKNIWQIEGWLDKRT